MYDSCVSHTEVVSVKFIPFLCAAVKKNMNRADQPNTFQRSSTLFPTITSERPRTGTSCNSPGDRGCLALEIRKEIPFLMFFSHSQVQRIVWSKQLMPR